MIPSQWLYHHLLPNLVAWCSITKFGCYNAERIGDKAIVLCHVAYWWWHYYHLESKVAECLLNVLVSLTVIGLACKSRKKGINILARPRSGDLIAICNATLEHAGLLSYQLYLSAIVGETKPCFRCNLVLMTSLSAAR